MVQQNDKARLIKEHTNTEATAEEIHTRNTHIYI